MTKIKHEGPSIKAKDIAAWLKKDWEVYSRCMGRYGKVLGIDGDFIKINMRKSVGVTRFDDGSRVKAIVQDGIIIIKDSQ